MGSVVSVIVPVYNVGNYLKACVESILAQSFEDIELLLIDDGSTDGSGELCDAFARQDPRVRVFHQKNAGVSAARNRGIDEARGEYFSFVDGDDLLSKDYLEALVLACQKYNCDVAACNYLEKTGEHLQQAPGRIRRYAVYRGADACFARYYQITSFGNRSYSSSCMKLFRRSAIGNLRFIRRVRIGEDTAFMYQCYAKGISIVEVPLEGYIYIQREGSATKGGVQRPLMKALPSWRVLIRATRECASDIQKLVSEDYSFLIYASISQLIKTADYGLYMKKSSMFRKRCREAFALNKMKIKHRIMLRFFLLSPELYWLVMGPFLRGKRRAGG